MITIKRHPNLDNWLNISFFGKLIEQTTCRAEALQIAGKLSRKHKDAEIYDLDANPIHLRHEQATRKSWDVQPFCDYLDWQSNHHFTQGQSRLWAKEKRQNPFCGLRTCERWSASRTTRRSFRAFMIKKISVLCRWVAFVFAMGLLWFALSMYASLLFNLWLGTYYFFCRGFSSFGWCFRIPLRLKHLRDWHGNRGAISPKALRANDLSPKKTKLFS